jgi:hypothetical protein
MTLSNVPRSKLPVTLSTHQFLTGMCATLPGAAMAIAHWFPWRKVIKRDLHKLETYAIGTAAIVGTAALALANDVVGDGEDHARMLMLAAWSAGATTLIAYTVDEFVAMRAEVAGLRAERDVYRGKF